LQSLSSIYVVYVHYTREELELCLVLEIENEMGWACGAYGRGERCAQGVGGEA
jgi:hypothetical protein